MEPFQHFGNAAARLPKPPSSSTPANLEELATEPCIYSPFAPSARVTELTAVLHGPCALVPAHAQTTPRLRAGWYTVDIMAVPWDPLARFMSPSPRGRQRPVAATELTAVPGALNMSRWLNPPTGSGRAAPLAALESPLQDGRAQALWRAVLPAPFGPTRLDVLRWRPGQRRASPAHKLARLRDLPPGVVPVALWGLPAPIWPYSGTPGAMFSRASTSLVQLGKDNCDRNRVLASVVRDRLLRVTPVAPRLGGGRRCVGAFVIRAPHLLSQVLPVLPRPACCDLPSGAGLEFGRVGRRGGGGCYNLPAQSE